MPQLTPHTQRWVYVVTPMVLLCTLIMVGVHFQGWDISWQQQRIRDGEFWRLWTGHWQHLSWSHWLMNQLGLMLIVWVSPKLLDNYRWLIAFVVISPIIGLGLMGSELYGYVGLSGVLYGLLLYGCLVDRSIPLHMKALVFCVVVGRVVIEQNWPEFNSLTEEQIGGFVAIDGHLFGTIGGLLLVLAELSFRKIRSYRKILSKPELHSD